MTELVEVRRGAYHDSVQLMQATRVVAQLPGVVAALVAMATELNLDLLSGMGFRAPAGAGPNDLVVAVRAADDASRGEALRALDRALAERPTVRGELGAPAPPRTTGAAARRADASIALISVPGRYAFVEAMDALEAGLSVMIFSDGVPVDLEVRLKDEAARRDLLVMGPDCGTAILGGVGLGFANAVETGPVSLVAASGTGAQQLCCLLDDAGIGVRHVLGVGGRDLSAEVAGRSTVQALAALNADPGTELIVVVSKPPAPAVAERVARAAAALGTPVVLALLGAGRPDLTAVAEDVARRLARDRPAWPEWPPPGAPPTGGRLDGCLRGLFSGGTLCDEAMVIAAERLGRIRSNIPLDPAWALPADLRAPGHLMIDFGDDALTAGRPHPMIDPTLRVERLRAEADDPDTAVILLDVVLGYAAHPDPAAELAPAIGRARAAATGRDLAVVVSLVGTARDPQGRDRQAEALRGAGAHVFASNAAAARHAVAMIAGG